MVFSVKNDGKVTKIEVLDSFFCETVNFAQKMVKTAFLGEIFAEINDKNEGFVAFFNKKGEGIGSFSVGFGSEIELLGKIEAEIIEFLSELELKNSGNRKVFNEKYATI